MKILNASSKNRSTIGVSMLIAILLVLVLALPALANGTWTSTGDLTYGRAEHQAVKLNDGRVLVVGGRMFTTASDTADIYDPVTGTWSETGPMNFSSYVKNSATLLADGRVLVAGSEALYSFDSTAAEIYDPASDSWTVTGFMNQGRSGHLAVRLNDGRVLVAGDQWGNTAAEIYDPAAGVWQVTGSMNANHGDGALALLPDGRVLVAGGFVRDPLLGDVIFAEAEIYDPATGNWQSTGSLNIARRAHTATTLADGRVLVAGGRNQSNAWLDSAEVYDAASGTWELTGTMNRSRYAHTATLLENGQVLAAGVPNATSGNIFSAELYDPTTGLWSNTADTPEERWSHTATLLDSGDVLLAGGIQTSDPSIPFDKVTAVLYTPGDGTSPTPTPPAPAVYVGDLDGSANQQGNRWQAIVVITVLNQNGNPVANATVDGNWSGDASGSASCTTGGDGTCTVESGNMQQNRSINATFAVTDVTHATLAYDPAANGDPDGDSNGTTITVSKP